MLLMSLALAMVFQWWQDTYVTSAYLSVRQYIADEHLSQLWMSEENPLYWGANRVDADVHEDATIVATPITAGGSLSKPDTRITAVPVTITQFEQPRG